MNIFFLDCSPKLSAQYQCDKHVVKMALESTQLLCCCHAPNTVPYKHTHRNHPCALWARASLSNYQWLYRHALALCEEYEYRFGKEHACKQVILSLLEFKHPCHQFIRPALAMPDEYKRKSVVASYRAYYKHKANTIDFKYTKREVPYFI